MDETAREHSDQRQDKPRIYRLGDQHVELPSGVTIADWALERGKIQNPRIRSLLGCVRNLESVLDSNYAILHCSPQRLHEIWARVKKVVALIRTELAPLLEEPSCIPKLDTERLNTIMALEILESSVLAELDSSPTAIEDGRLMEVRKLLCVGMGKVHAFLQDAFARIVAADPRSRFDADYFLSRRFPNDIEEAEWLWVSVQGISWELARLHPDRVAHLEPVAKSLATEYDPADEEAWSRVSAFLAKIDELITPRLREILGLRGIRFDEMEVLDRFATELPVHCTVVTEIGELVLAHKEELKALPGTSETAREVVSATQMLLQGATNRHLSKRMTVLNERLTDLEAFVPFWIEELGRRRALMLRSLDGADDAPAEGATVQSGESAGP